MAVSQTKHHSAESEGKTVPTFSALSGRCIRYAGDDVRNSFLHYDLAAKQHRSFYLSWFNDPDMVEVRMRYSYQMPTGRLFSVCQGGGKRRIFAIGNYVSQRLLKSFHDWLFAILRTIPMDGTFNQSRPLDLLSGASSCWSYDLKSATDRFPI